MITPLDVNLIVKRVKTRPNISGLRSKVKKQWCSTAPRSSYLLVLHVTCSQVLHVLCTKCRYYVRKAQYRNVTDAHAFIKTIPSPSPPPSPPPASPSSQGIYHKEAMSALDTSVTGLILNGSFSGLDDRSKCLTEQSSHPSSPDSHSHTAHLFALSLCHTSLIPFICCQHTCQEQLGVKWLGKSCWHVDQWSLASNTWPFYCLIIVSITFTVMD